MRAARRWLTRGGSVQCERPALLAPGPLVLVAAFASGASQLYVIGYALLLLTIGTYVWVVWTGTQLRITRRLVAAPARAGERIEEQWTLTNNGWLPLLWLTIADASTVPGYATRRVATVPGGGARNWHTSSAVVQRGVARLGPYRWSCGDPFGIFSYTGNESTTGVLLVAPALAAIPVMLPPGASGARARGAEAAQLRSSQVGGVREYLPGDPLNRIHWPTTARTGNVMVRRLDADETDALLIVLDSYAAAYPPSGATSGAEPVDWDNPFELAVVLAATYAAHASAAGRVVGIVLADSASQPGQSSVARPHYTRIDAVLAAAQPGTTPVERLLARVSRTAAIVVITPDLSGGWAALLPSTRATVLLIEPVAGQGAALIARLQRIGCVAHAFVAGAALPLIDATTQYRQRVPAIMTR